MMLIQTWSWSCKVYGLRPVFSFLSTACSKAWEQIIRVLTVNSSVRQLGARQMYWTKLPPAPASSDWWRLVHRLSMSMQTWSSCNMLYTHTSWRGDRFGTIYSIFNSAREKEQSWLGWKRLLFNLWMATWACLKVSCSEASISPRIPSADTENVQQALCPHSLSPPSPFHNESWDVELLKGSRNYFSVWALLTTLGTLKKLGFLVLFGGGQDWQHGISLL